MKNILLNLYQRDYTTFYLLGFLIDTLSLWLFKFPIFFLAIAFTQMIIAGIIILKKFKK